MHGDLQLASPPHVMSLPRTKPATERQVRRRSGQQSQCAQQRGQHGMRIAADRIFGNAERRAEHAGLGLAVRHCRPEREQKESGCGARRRQGCETCQVRLHARQAGAVAQGDQRTCTLAAGCHRRATLVQVFSMQAQCAQRRRQQRCIKAFAHLRGGLRK